MRFLGQLLTLLIAIIFGFWLSASGVLTDTVVGDWMDSIMEVLPKTSNTWKNVESLEDIPASLSDSITLPGEETDTLEDNSRDTAELEAPSENPEVDYNIVRSEIIRLTNELRTEEGLNPLSNNDLLREAADIRAQETSESFSHTRPDGRDAFTVFDDGIPYNYRIVGENLGMATYYMNEEEMAELLFNGWVESQGHYENLVRSDFQEIGVGVHYDGEYLYATQIFGTPQ